MDEAIKHIAKILRCDQDYLYKIDTHFSEVTGKKHIFDTIFNENKIVVEDRMRRLGLSMHASAKEVYDALISKVEADDHTLHEALGKPSWTSQRGCERVAGVAQEVIKNSGAPTRGFFLKKKKAEELLRREPPRKILAYLGYTSVEKMLEKEDLCEIFCALRFVEGSEWLNKKFFKLYEELTPKDFEEREIEVKALSSKWNNVAQVFVMKKWHNISHLKELGVVFIIPISLGISGELLRMMSLVLHYLHEVPFYSDMFRIIGTDKKTFSKNLISLLRGDVVEKRPIEGEKTLWLVVQRYLAKDDENEWRLFVPRINPEALHWARASSDLAQISDVVPIEGGGLSFWEDLDWVGDYFKDDVGNDVLVSFNVVDTVMSLVQKKELIKYLYHHQEALWNKVFEKYFGDRLLEKAMKKHLLRGYFEI
ncbi:MAG: hypothetical protein AB1333_03940 [Patescibacteria group bacterium]